MNLTRSDVGCDVLIRFLFGLGFVLARFGVVYTQYKYIYFLLLHLIIALFFLIFLYLRLFFSGILGVRRHLVGLE